MTYGVLGLVVLVLDIIAILQVVQSGIDGTKKAVWIIIILVLPLLGMILWFLLGRK
jgi:hypothetical protein